MFYEDLSTSLINGGRQGNDLLMFAILLQHFVGGKHIGQERKPAVLLATLSKMNIAQSEQCSTKKVP